MVLRFMLNETYILSTCILSVTDIFIFLSNTFVHYSDCFSSSAQNFSKYLFFVFDFMGFILFIWAVFLN